VKVGGDPAPLSIGRLGRPLHQPLTFELGASHPPRQAPRQGDNEDRERDQAHDQHRRERPREFAPATRDARRALVGLEEQWSSPGGLDPRVDLHQLPEASLVAVLRGLQV
jgi:hypothetical protein